ncbi:MAG: hypothetical protein GVY11_07160 [Gammaproteobacteria bacterium]|jgi:hypothetical protein|nr:hypothetical protein [Gammaproteobacteria bacterium]
MSRFKHVLIMFALIAAGAQAQTAGDAPWSIVPDSRPTDESGPIFPLLGERSALGLPYERPRLSMTLPLPGRQNLAEDEAGSAFSWSLKAWQMNTASLAHIQCSQGLMTMDSYLAQDCRFVDRPLPRDAGNMLEVSGDWLAAPGLKLGVSAFRGDDAPALAEAPFSYGLIDERRLLSGTADDVTVEGLDFNVSFGIQTERVGDFLVGLQLARYRQRMSMSELGMNADGFGVDNTQYGNSAQLLLGWRHGSFSGEMLGHHREIPLWLAGGDAGASTLNSFDLEFSWHAPRNASFSIGVSNVMDAAPRADEANIDANLEDPLESVYGRIPYVRYKQDL